MNDLALVDLTKDESRDISGQKLGIIATSPSHISEIIRLSERNSIAFVCLPEELEGYKNYYLKDVPKVGVNSTHKHKTLIENNDKLHLLIEHSTKQIRDSKKAIEKKLSNLRKLILFVKELTKLVAHEEVLLLIREQLKSYHGVKSQFIAFQDNYSGPKIMFTQGAQVQSKLVDSVWKQGLRFRDNDKDDKQYLANIMERPFIKTLAIPLVISAEQEAGAGPIPTLFIEHDLNSEVFAGFLAEITERLQPLCIALERINLETELRNTSLIWERTFDSIQDPFCIVDIDYNLLRSNHAFGNKSKNLKCYQIFAQREAPCVGCPMKRRDSHEFTSMGNIKRGSQVYEAYSYPINYIDGGATTTYVNHYVDVTAENELRSQVVQNEKMAAIGHLAGNIAHELNNPLSGIRSMAQILAREQGVKKQVQEDIVEIELAADRCQTIINNLLEFSDESNAENFKPLSLQVLVQKTLAFLKSATRNHNVQIESLATNDCVLVDGNLMQQVVFNIVNNACQAMDKPGTISIEIKDHKQNVILEIADDGPGIDPQIANKIFDPFFTTKPEGQGTGLGLSMVKSVVEKFKGQVQVNSEPHKGTCFVIQLPRYDENTNC